MDLLETFLSQRIQPVQARDHAMWHYSGTRDSTWSHPEEVSEEIVAQWLKSITRACDNPVGAKRVLPFSTENKPKNAEWINMHSPVLNGEKLDVGEESACDSVDNDYIEDSEDSEGDSEESEEEIQFPPRN
ncbi:Aspartic proteinase nepenthesin-1 [Hordeum vulgare]|nr:Aspartic proteinase nepenthesin-1 [Hordeum vulgare]